MLMKPKRLGLYFHIPFCLSKCAYCDFFSFVPSNGELIVRYFDALIKHMEEYKKAAEDHVVDTVFIGGGTPTCVPTVVSEFFCYMNYTRFPH